MHTIIRRVHTVGGIAAMTVLATAAAAVPAGASPQRTATSVVYYPMDEPVGSTTMVADGGAGPNGVIGNEVDLSKSFDGHKGYTFERLEPNTPPTHPEHLVSVPDDPRLDADGGQFSIEIRYRTTNKFGNLIQKGQSQTPGGQIKIQLPKGEPQCNYKGANGGVSVRSYTAINDGQWHVLKCTRTVTGVDLYVDGVLRVRKAGTTGVLNNSFPLTIAGKPKCDQIDVTCDYFGGQVDWVRITKG